jgi:hypothetical protein
MTYSFDLSELLFQFGGTRSLKAFAHPISIRRWSRKLFSSISNFYAQGHSGGRWMMGLQWHKNGPSRGKLRPHLGDNHRRGGKAMTWTRLANWRKVQPVTITDARNDERRPGLKLPGPEPRALVCAFTVPLESLSHRPSPPVLL